MAPQAPEPFHILHNSSGAVTSLTWVVFDGDEYLTSGSEIGTITIWNLKTFRPSRNWEAHTTAVTWISSVSCTIISQGRSESIKVWNREGILMGRISSSHSGFCKCDLRHSFLAAPAGKNGIITYNISKIGEFNAMTTLNLDHDEGTIMALKLTPNALISAYESGSICKWGETSVIAHTQVEGMPTCIEFSFLSGEVLLGTSTDQVHILDQDLRPKRQVQLRNGGLNCLSIRHDGRIYASSGWDHRLRVFSAKSHKSLCVLELHDESLNCLAFGQTLLASGSSDALISLWNLYN